MAGSGCLLFFRRLPGDGRFAVVAHNPIALLARFYAALLDQPITYENEDFVVVAANDQASGLGFQLAPDHRAPTWPEPEVPQQMHLDIMVDDVAQATPQVIALGARSLGGNNVFADPAGHPFCLIRRPEWAPPLFPDHPRGR